MTIPSKPRPRHRHRYSKPYFMSTVGLVKSCRAPNCPKRMKAVRSGPVLTTGALSRGEFGGMR